MLLSMVLMTTFDIIINPDKGDMEICWQHGLWLLMTI
jgi:flagellar motor switch protein FliM